MARQLDDEQEVSKLERRTNDDVADLENGNADAVEDAVIGAWELQSGK